MNQLKANKTNEYIKVLFFFPFIWKTDKKKIQNSRLYMFLLSWRKWKKTHTRFVFPVFFLFFCCTCWLIFVRFVYHTNTINLLQSNVLHSTIFLFPNHKFISFWSLFFWNYYFLSLSISVHLNYWKKKQNRKKTHT